MTTLPAVPARKPKIPLFHLTDLYHPPDDPDDHFDLATLLALEEFDLRGVGLDASHRALEGETDGFKICCVLLNAGSCGDGSESCEWNVLLDRAAFIGLWRSGLPIRWYPCSTQEGAFHLGENERGTHWHATHEELFRNLPLPLKGWFGYSLSGNGRGDIIRALGDCGRAIPWANLQAARRNLWSTASLVMAAGRVLARTPQGWRFRPADEAGDLPTWPFRLDAIESTIDERGVITWQPVPPGPRPPAHALFGRQGGAAYGTAMTEALNALLQELPL